eukprot:jgi/Orpsp1_1/1183494/evm.model.c7180000085446.1
MCLKIIGYFFNVPDGTYVPEFKFKISKYSYGLEHLAFKARILEIPKGDENTYSNILVQEPHSLEIT